MRLIDRDTMRLIDANALIEALLDARREQTETTLKLIRFVEKQPTVEPKNEGRSVFEESVNADRAVCVYVPSEPKRGWWTTAYGDHIHAGLRPVYIYCSECGMVSTVTWNYCPNCGARMEADE